jgi:hypothetical protein
MDRLTKPEARALKLGCLLIVLLLVGCSKGKPAALTDVFPGADVSPDWMPADEVEVFDRENIYDLVDGQADAFFRAGGGAALRGCGGHIVEHRDLAIGETCRCLRPLHRRYLRRAC